MNHHKQKGAGRSLVEEPGSRVVEEAGRSLVEEPGSRVVEESGHREGKESGQMVEEEPGCRVVEEPGQMEGEVSGQSTRSRLRLQNLTETPVRGRIQDLSYRSVTVTRFA